MTAKDESFDPKSDFLGKVRCDCGDVRSATVACLEYGNYAEHVCIYALTSSETFNRRSKRCRDVFVSLGIPRCLTVVEGGFVARTRDVRHDDRLRGPPGVRCV